MNYALIIFFAISTLFITSSAQADADVRVYSGKDLKTFSISNPAGEIDVSSSSDGKAHLIIDKRDFEGCDDMEIDFTMTKLSVNVTGKLGNTRCEVNFEIKLPVTVAVEIKSGFGTIIVSDMQEEVKIKSGSGNIHLNGVNLPSLSAKTGAGNIHVTGNVVDTDIKSGAGNVNLTLNQLSSRGQISVRTGAGNSTITLPKDSSVSVDATSAIGQIKNDFQQGAANNGSTNKPFKVSVKSGMGNVNVRSM